MANLNTSSKYHIIYYQVLALSWQLPLRPENKISPSRNAKRNLIQILSKTILYKRFENAVYQTIFNVADYFSVEVPVGTIFLSCPFNSIFWIGRQVKFIKSSLPILKSTPNEFMAKELESTGENYNRLTRDKSIETMYFYLDTMPSRRINSVDFAQKFLEHYVTTSTNPQRHYS